MFKPLGGGRGILSLNGKEIKTPNFIVPTIRGAVAHLTPDNYPKVPVAAVYIEHFVDQHGFATEAAKSLPLNTEITLMAARPPGSALLQKPNTDTAVGVSTFQGTQQLDIDSISKSISDLKASIVVSPYDVPSKPGPPGKNRVRKMEERSANWLAKFRANLAADTMILAGCCAELANCDYIQQADGASGASNVEIKGDKLRVCEERVSLGDIPQLLGKYDLFYTDFDEYTEKGQAILDSSTVIDLHDKKYAQDMQVLGETGYTLAYIHHLLNAREMTANVILQKHNLSIVAKFFDSL